MKVCWFGSYDPAYSRNRILMSGLSLADVEVIECNVTKIGWRKYPALIRELRKLRNEYDVLYCAFPAFSTVLFAYLFQKRPIATDAFFPIYDAVVRDRKTVSAFSPRAWFLYIVDCIQVLVSDVVIVDTQNHKDYFSRWTRRDTIRVIPVGVHTDDFYPLPEVDRTDKFVVQFHGSYIPLQGVDKIVRAAALLKQYPDITFRFIGAGQEFAAIQKLIAELEVQIEIVPWLTTEALNQKLNEADVILGIFGAVPKTDRVIPNKLYQGLAVAKPVLTKDTQVVRSHFSDDDMYFSTNDPEMIAQQIVVIRDAADRARVAQSGYQKVTNLYSQQQLGEQLKKVLRTMLV